MGISPNLDTLNKNVGKVADAQVVDAHQSTPQSSLGTRVFYNTAAMLGGRVAGLAFSGVSSVLLARFLGRQQMGEYGAVYAYLSLYAFLGSFCLEQILAREVSIRKEKAAELFHTGTLSALGFALLGLILAPLAAPLFGYTGAMRWVIVIAALDMLILPPFRFSAIIFQVEMRLWYNVGIGLFRQALWLAALVLLIFGKAAFYQVILARTFCGVAEMAALLWSVQHLKLVQGTRRFLAKEARRMLHAGFPLVLTTMAVGIYLRIDQVMLHKIAGDRALGPYVVAVQLTELFSTLPVALMTALFPALAQSAHDEQKFLHYLTESYRLLLVVVFAACAIVTPVAAAAVQIFYGKEFLPTADLLVVLIWSEAPVFFAVALGNALIAKGLQKYSPASAGAGAVINIVLNIYLIPRYGALGASWATVISYCVAGIFFLLLFSEMRPLVMIGLRAALWPCVLALGISLLLPQLHLAIWWRLALAGASYFVGVLVTGTIQPGDLTRLRTIWRKDIARA